MLYIGVDIHLFLYYKKLINLYSFSTFIFFQLLTQHTNCCINRRSAKNISEQSVIFLLQQKYLIVNSEKELVDFCANWAKGKQPSGR